jgi:hypothetical protein
VRRLSPCGQRRGRQTVTESGQRETRGQRRIVGHDHRLDHPHHRRGRRHRPAGEPAPLRVRRSSFSLARPASAPLHQGLCWVEQAWCPTATSRPTLCSAPFFAAASRSRRGSKVRPSAPTLPRSTAKSTSGGKRRDPHPSSGWTARRRRWRTSARRIWSARRGLAPSSTLRRRRHNAARSDACSG